MKKFNMESFFPAEETIKKGLSEARKKQQEEELGYTFEELKEAWNNPTPMTAEEIKNTFIEDGEPIDFSKLKIKKI